jgi:hypothetical protein
MWLRFFRGGGEDARRGGDCHSDAEMRKGAQWFQANSLN